MAAAAASLKEYLKRYQSGDDQAKKKKKKKKKPNPNPMATGVLVVDEDPIWHKPVLIEQESDSSGEEKPLIEEDIEVKRMKRLEAIRSLKPYNSISDDGSGWVSITDSSSKQVSSSDLSPPRQRRRYDTPSPGRDREHDLSGEGGDLSPPRQRRGRLDTPSPEREADGDLSPPRRQAREHRDSSPSRKSRRGSPDARQKRGSPAPDFSPPRRSRKGSSFDLPPLPPRRSNETLKTKESSIDDLSPPRRSLKGSSGDMSPPRQRQGQRRMDSPEREVDGDLSPPRRQTRERRDPSATDLSPPRKSRRGSLDAPELSPPRRSRKGSSFDLPPLPPRRSNEILKTKESPDDDLSPPRRSLKGSSGDLSPPRRRQSPEGSRIKESTDADLSPPRKRKEEAPKNGLLSKEDLRDHNIQQRKEELSGFSAIDPSKLGKGAQPVFRDSQGRRISKEEILRQQEEEKPKEKKLEWGKGLAQKREAESKAQELELERDKPFARTRDDPELDKMLKERIRWGDPMAHLVKHKHSEEPLLEDLGDDDKMKASGFIIPQTIPSHSWIKRGLDFPPNRYGIRPGRHWDGVDRSSGYEKELFKRQNEKRATDSEAYLWSVSDM